LHFPHANGQQRIPPMFARQIATLPFTPLHLELLLLLQEDGQRRPESR
jgi:hypothetical protein